MCVCALGMKCYDGFLVLIGNVSQVTNFLSVTQNYPNYYKHLNLFSRFSDTLNRLAVMASWIFFPLVFLSSKRRVRISDIRLQRCLNSDFWVHIGVTKYHKFIRNWCLQNRILSHLISYKLALTQIELAIYLHFTPTNGEEITTLET